MRHRDIVNASDKLLLLLFDTIVILLHNYYTYYRVVNSFPKIFTTNFIIFLISLIITFARYF